MDNYPNVFGQKSNISTNVKKAMPLIDEIKKRGVSVAELAKATGIPAARIYKWYAGTQSPKHEDSIKLDKYLKGIPTEQEEEAADDARISALHAVVVDLYARVYGVSAGEALLHVEKMMQLAAKQRSS